MKLTKIKDCIGKTILGVAQPYDNSSIVITYSDGTYSVLTYKRIYDDTEIVDGELETYGFKDSELADIGLQSEVERIRAEISEKVRAAQAKSELFEKQEYARLKAKFGGGN